MATDVDPPNENPGDGDPGDPGYVPPTGPDTKIAVVVTNPGVTFAAAQIIAAGGPWPNFKVRVTPVNDYGVGAYAEVVVVVDTPDDDIIEDDT